MDPADKLRPRTWQKITFSKPPGFRQLMPIATSYMQGGQIRVRFGEDEQMFRKIYYELSTPDIKTLYIYTYDWLVCNALIELLREYIDDVEDIEQLGL